MVNNLKLLIKSNIKTFVSVLLLTMLGVGFLVGMKSAVPNLKYTVDSYYNKYNVFDIELVSSVGFTDDDIAKFKTVSDIKSIEGAYYKDFVIKGNSDDFVLRIHSFSNKDDQINQFELIEGNYPNNSNDIVIEDLLRKNQNYKINDIITIEDDLLNESEFKIVGFIKSPLYLSSNKGSTNLLSGRVNYYAYVNKNSINSDLYSNIYIKLNNLKSIDKVVKDIKEVGKDAIEVRYKEVIEEYNKKITTGQSELDKKRQETNKEIKKYEEQIANAEQQIISAEKSIPTVKQAEAMLANRKSELAKVKKELDSAKSQIDSARKKYNNSIKEYNTISSSISETKREIAEARKNGTGGPELDELENFLRYYESSLPYYKGQLDEAKVELDARQKEYNLSYAEYQKVANMVNAKSAQELIDQAKKEVANKRKELESNRKKLETKKEEVSAEFDKFQNQLNDAKDYLKLISVSSWNVNKRENILTYSQYLSDIKRIEKIGNYFPIIFYIVAVLITLTNISRIIEKGRDEIGLYKALGYSSRDISKEYMSFALVSCIAGSILGIALGLFIIPKVFYNVYKIIYYLPSFVYIIDYKIIIIAILIAVVLVTSSSFISIRKTIKEWPANLLRPKQNTKGKRVLIEKIKVIWDRLNFTNKVTFRNIFKYPKRFIMTILGISGCISLIIAGFNLKSAITNIIPLQFNHVFDIDVEIFLKDSIARSDVEEENERIKALKEVDSTILSYVKYVYLNNTENRANLVIPEDNDLLLDFVILENNNKKYNLTNDGVIITKKIANEMNIKEGDSVKLRDSENNVFDVKVKNIVDNYVDNYIYIGREYYNKILGFYPKYNTILARFNNVSIDEKELTNKFNENNNVSYLIYTSTSKVMYDNLTSSLNCIVLILVISAVILAFVVLYNLNSLNVEERKREIATIKVLGFNKKETYKYIENEIKRLTIIGIVIGIFFGYIFSRVLIKSCELDNLMYDYSINYFNYLYSIIITVIFMIITSLIGRKNIERIDMIESLKKVE